MRCNKNNDIKRIFDAERGSRQVSVIHVSRTGNAIFQREQNKKDFKAASLKSLSTHSKDWCLEPESNRHASLKAADFKSAVSTNFTIEAHLPHGASTTRQVLHQPTGQRNKKGKLLLPFSKLGAGKRVRTVDLYLGKVSLYQLSYSRISESIRLFRTESNYSQKISLTFQVRQISRSTGFKQPGPPAQGGL